MKNPPTDEILKLFEVDDLPSNVVNNSKWLIPMATDKNIINSEINIKSILN